MKSFVILLAILLTICFTSVASARPHHRWGVNLQVSLNLQHPEIKGSKKAPEDVLVDKAKAYDYYLKVISAKKEVVRVAIPRSANKDMYIDFLKGLGFVTDVKEVKRQ